MTTEELMGSERFADLTPNQIVQVRQAHHDNPDGFVRLVASTAKANSPNGLLMKKLAQGAHHTNVVPIRPAPEPEIVQCDQAIAERWKRVEHLVRTVPIEHEWRALHRELVTQNVLAAYVRGEESWTAPDEGIGILGVLEIEAARHGLNRKPTEGQTLAQRLLATLGA